MLCFEALELQMAPMTVEVEQQHVAALADFARSALEPFAAPPSATADPGARPAHRLSRGRPLAMLGCTIACI